MALKAAAKKRGKSASVGEGSDSFVYRGVRITRTWKFSKRSKAIGEAMRKVIQRGPTQTPAS
jgi:hypothetical protein